MIALLRATPVVAVGSNVFSGGSRETNYRIGWGSRCRFDFNDGSVDARSRFAERADAGSPRRS